LLCKKSEGYFQPEISCFARNQRVISNPKFLALQEIRGLFPTRNSNSKKSSAHIKMPACPTRSWGAKDFDNRPKQDTGASKEMDEKLKQLIAKRDSLDQQFMCTSPVAKDQPQQPSSLRINQYDSSSQQRAVQNQGYGRVNPSS